VAAGDNWMGWTWGSSSKGSNQSEGAYTNGYIEVELTSAEYGIYTATVTFTDRTTGGKTVVGRPGRVSGSLADVIKAANILQDKADAEAGTAYRGREQAKRAIRNRGDAGINPGGKSAGGTRNVFGDQHHTSGPADPDNNW
jgi:hypothetical protein